MFGADALSHSKPRDRRVGPDSPVKQVGWVASLQVEQQRWPLSAPEQQCRTVFKLDSVIVHRAAVVPAVDVACTLPLQRVCRLVPHCPVRREGVQPVVRMDDKDNIGAFIKMAPANLQHIGNIDFVDLNTTNQGYWQVGVNTIIEKAEKAGAFPKPEPAAPSKRSRYLSSSSVVAPAPDKSPHPVAGAPAPAAAGQPNNDLQPFDEVQPFDDVTGFTVSS